MIAYKTEQILLTQPIRQYQLDNENKTITKNIKNNNEGKQND